jgi:replicative DNA helicase
MAKNSKQAKPPDPTNGLPASLDAERFVLGSVLLDFEKHLPSVQAALESDDFILVKHQTIYRRILELHQRHEKVDRVTVAEALQHYGELESCDGLTYLTSLDDGLPRIPNIDAYIRIVKEKAIRRRVIHSAQALTNRALLNTEETEKLIEEGSKLFGGLEAERRQLGPDLRRDFRASDDGTYSLTIPCLGVALEVDRLRRERGGLVGELSVRCDLPGMRTVNGGSLSTADLNLSSARDRLERAKLLAARSGNTFDWDRLIEELCQHVLDAEKAGQASVDLRDVQRPAQDDLLHFEGLALPRRHPAILFGDGGTAKSYLGMYLAGRMAESGLSVALFDWELEKEDHRVRLERLFPDGMPRIRYAKCDRALTYETDRLRRIIREDQIQYAVFDSVAFACDGPPEESETAAKYFRAVRQIGVGSLHIAHITKADSGDQKPFGSAFWHNGARSTWFVKADPASEGTRVLRIGLFHRKANLGPLSSPLAFAVTFGDANISFRRTDIADSPDLVERLTVRQRVTLSLCHEAKTVMTLAQELDLDVNTVTQTINRYLKKNRIFKVLGGEGTDRMIGLLARDTVS